MEFDGKIALITGASGGLGAALCAALLARGAVVIAFDRDQNALERLGLQHPDTPRLILRAGDITDEITLQELANEIKEMCGRLDLLVHNAGVTHFSRFSESGAQVTRRVMNVNFTGAIMLTGAVLPMIKKSKGTIVALSSVAGFAPLFARTAYAASKHALHGFFESLRSELVEDGVHIMMVCPSFISTQSNTSNQDQAPEKGLSRPGSATETAGTALQPEFVAQAIITGIQQQKRQLIIGRLAKLSWIASRLFPAFYEKKMLERMKDEIP